MKIDGRSLVLGILAGIAIGSVLSFVLTQSQPFRSTATEQYIVTMRIRYYPMSYPSGAIAVFRRDNVTIGEHQIWVSPAVNITVQKGDYTVEIYKGDSGLYVKTLQIYVAKNIEIEV
jgi:hypothetical protein